MYRYLLSAIIWLADLCVLLASAAANASAETRGVVRLVLLPAEDPRRRIGADADHHDDEHDDHDHHGHDDDGHDDDHHGLDDGHLDDDCRGLPPRPRELY